MKIGLIYNWPGARNSELDLIGRIYEVLESLGHTAFILDPFGKPLDLEGNYTEPREIMDGQQLAFAINLHYTTPNLLDCPSYFTNWNPLDFIRKHPITGETPGLDEEVYVAGCLQSHDAALSAGSDEIDSHYRAVNAFNPVFTDLDAPPFYTSCQSIDGIEPVTLESPRIFYIGINWESLVESHEGRHPGLLELLDKLNFTRFYGVEKLNGKLIWENFSNYRGELPFDQGHSIVRESNRCGISLVLSSDAHRKSGVVSTRIFQACAARTVIITDDNPFIEKFFGDSVITFRYSSCAEDNLHQIEEAFRWICANPDAARKKAESAYQLFHKQYALEKQVQNLIAWHSRRDSSRPADCNNQSVHVFWICRQYDAETTNRFISSLNCQKSAVINATICIPNAEEESLRRDLAENAHFSFAIVTVTPPLWPNGWYIADALEKSDSEFFCIYQNGDQWMSTHLEGLQAMGQKTDADIIHSKAVLLNTAWNSNCNNTIVRNACEPLSRAVGLGDLEALNLDDFSSSQFLFRRRLVSPGLTAIISQLHANVWCAAALYLYQSQRRLPEFLPRYTVRRQSRIAGTTGTNIDTDAIAADRRSLHLYFRHATEIRFANNPGPDTNAPSPVCNEANTTLPRRFPRLRNWLRQYPLARTIYQRLHSLLYR